MQIIFASTGPMPLIYYSANQQHSSCKQIFTSRVENTMDPDQMASSEAS